MAATTVLPAPHDVLTTLNYYSPIGDEPPFQYVQQPPEGRPKDNLGVDTRAVVVQDVRGVEDSVSLDSTGFQFVKHVSEETNFEDEERIKSVYYKEVEEILKAATGAKKIVIFDHTIRKSKADSAIEQSGAAPKFAALLKTIGANGNSDSRGPVERVHIDQTFDASVARVHRHLGEDAERLLKSRVRIINVWRPIANPVAHKPLAVADWRTLNVEQDLVTVRFIYPEYEGSTYAVKYSPQLKWFYLSNQTPEEVTLIKCYDSETDRARLTPHSAFVDNSSPKNAPQRQSIEVRCLVFDDE